MQTPGASKQFTQANRLLRLTTPLGSDVLLAESVRGEEGISQGFEFRISALSLDAGISLRSLLGQPALLELLTITAREPRSFHGHLVKVEFDGANGGMARYTLSLQPWTAFLAHGRDSRVFQDMTVFDILDAVFQPWRCRGKLQPEWRFDIADRSLYPTRSLTTQYQESDLAFAERLMSEDGLFYFFEHCAAPGAPNLGSHQMVIADHNGAFKRNTQPVVRFTRPGAVMKQDSMDRWRRELRLQTNAIALRSWDYRALDTVPVTASAVQPDGTSLVNSDSPGAYAYNRRRHGERLADNQMKALESRREIFIGAGTVRTLAPGTTFTLAEHPSHDREHGENAASFAITRVVHLMHNNLSAEMRSDIAKRIGAGALSSSIDAERLSTLHAASPQQGDRPLYRNRIDAVRSSVPYRPRCTDDDGALLHPRPTVRGQQTAIVVGPPDAAVFTDRDHRIKIQFHWQRDGGKGTSHSRLSHPNPDGHTGAPADERASTWVRVASCLAPIAGANWGGNALPRVGQEVLVDFLDGDIDRPVVVGAVYNGKGRPDAQDNQVYRGTGAATGNAPAWFPGDATSHAHPAVLSGLKSQAMKNSPDGSGAYSQLVFDDSPAQSRLSLQRHARPHDGTDELNLGHLRHQSDNQRLQPTGFGAELKTEHSVALRAGQGMLLTSDRRNGACGTQMDSAEAHRQLIACRDLQAGLAETAQKHNAALTGKNGQMEASPADLPAIAQMTHSAETVDVRSGDASGTSAKEYTTTKAGYTGPQLQLSSPAGIAASTPSSAIFAAGDTTSICAGQAINCVAQANSYCSVIAGISLFTYGRASTGEQPNKETGIKLHAASGKVSSQTQAGQSRLTADKTITVASVTKTVSVMARQHVLMVAQGAYLKLEGGNIMLHAPGAVDFKATRKELAGPQNCSADLKAMSALSAMASINENGNYTGRYVLSKTGDKAFQGYRYKVESVGTVLLEGKTGRNGETGWVDTEKRRHVQVYKAVMRADQRITEDWQSALEQAGAHGPTEGAAAPLDDAYIGRYAEDE